MLNLGDWTDQNMSFLDHFECSKHYNCKSTAWQPYNCNWNIYTSSQAHTCLKNKNILIFGDSRARQLYRALISRLTYDDRVYDDLDFKNDSDDQRDWHLRTDFLRRDQNITVKWSWQCNLYKDFFNKHPDLLDVKNKDRNLTMVDIPYDVIIFNSMLLHSTRACKDLAACSFQFDNFKKDFLELLPNLKKLLKIKPNIKIIWMGNEDLFVLPENKNSYRGKRISWSNSIRNS